LFSSAALARAGAFAGVIIGSTDVAHVAELAIAFGSSQGLVE
jgi:hypothetical protein